MPDKPRDDKDLKRLPTEEELERQLREMGFDEEPDAANSSDEYNEADKSNESHMSDKSDKSDQSDRLPPEAEDEFELRLREIDGRIGETVRDHDTAADQIDREFDSKVQELEKRAKRTQEEREARKRDTLRKGAAAGEDAKGLGVGITVAYTIIGMPLAGAGLGWLLDRAMGTAFWVPACLVAGGVLGIMFAVMTVNKTYQDK